MVQTSERRSVSVRRANALSPSGIATLDAVNAQLSGSRASLRPAACRGRASSPLGWKSCILRTSDVVRYRDVFSRRSDRRRILLFSRKPLIREIRPVAKRSLLPHIDCLVSCPVVFAIGFAAETPPITVAILCRTKILLRRRATRFRLLREN